MAQNERKPQISEAEISETLKLTGRVLWLTKDPELIRAQIEGEDFQVTDSDMLLDWANTDQLIPSYACMQYSDSENLGRFLCTGYEGIEKDEISNSDSQALVLGESAGRGSSREHLQLALRGAGIRVVIAKSFERIFWENCRNWCIPCLPFESEVSQKLIRGDTVSWEEILLGYDKLSQDILNFGGLLPYTKARLEGKVSLPVVATALRPMTIVERIIARNTRVTGESDGVAAVKPGDVLVAKVDKKYAYELQTIISQKVLEETFGKEAPVKNDNTWLFEDHLALMPPDIPITTRHRDAQRAFAQKYQIAEYRAGRDGVEGICHTVMLEKHVLPGELGLGNDSHTCHLGVTNALAVAKGASELAAALLTGDIPLEVPETIRVVLKGKLKPGLTTTDGMLHIISRQDFKDGIASGRVLQFGGQALDDIDVDEQATFTNMSIEGQAFTGIVEPNEKLVEFMIKKHKLDRETVENLFVYPDEGAVYFDEIEIDLDDVQRMVSLPGDTQNAVPLQEVEGTKIDFFYIGSCKQGNLESLRKAAMILKGRRIAEGVRMQVQANTRWVEETLRAEGIFDIYEQAGVEVIARGCGPCMGATTDANERKETVLSATDRNFANRMGKNRTVYLAGVEVVAASAVLGYIAAPEDIAKVA